MSAQTRFQIALAFVLQAEGGYSDDPGDPGGATNFGITHIDYDAYRQSKGEPTQDVRNITHAEVEDIYSTRYWLPSHAEGLTAPLDLVHFDTAVNMGLGRAFLLINQVFGVASNSEKWLPATSAAAHSTTTPNQDAQAYINKRIALYESFTGEHQFLQGWLNRMDALEIASGLKP